MKRRVVFAGVTKITQWTGCTLKVCEDNLKTCTKSRDWAVPPKRRNNLDRGKKNTRSVCNRAGHCHGLGGDAHAFRVRSGWTSSWVGHGYNWHSHGTREVANTSTFDLLAQHGRCLPPPARPPAHSPPQSIGNRCARTGIFWSERR